VNGFASRRQLKESAKIFGGFNTHDEALQRLALVLADEVAAQRREFYRDLFLGHGIARITLGNIDARGLAAIGGDGHGLGWNLGKSAATVPEIEAWIYVTHVYLPQRGLGKRAGDGPRFPLFKISLCTKRGGDRDSLREGEGASRLPRCVLYCRIMRNARRLGRHPAAAIRMKVRSNFPVDMLVRDEREVSRRVEQRDLFMLEITERGRVMYEAVHA